jgi:hypothetical protein
LGPIAIISVFILGFVVAWLLGAIAIIPVGASGCFFPDGVGLRTAESTLGRSLDFGALSALSGFLTLSGFPALSGFWL